MCAIDGSTRCLPTLLLALQVVFQHWKLRQRLAGGGTTISRRLVLLLLKVSTGPLVHVRMLVVQPRGSQRA